MTKQYYDNEFEITKVYNVTCNGKNYICEVEPSDYEINDIKNMINSYSIDYVTEKEITVNSIAIKIKKST